jgi:predicted transcriptional regulator
MNRSNRFAQLISLTIRLHPEIKPALKEVAEKDPEFLKLLEPVQQVIGKEESASSTVG